MFQTSKLNFLSSLCKTISPRYIVFASRTKKRKLSHNAGTMPASFFVYQAKSQRRSRIIKKKSEKNEKKATEPVMAFLCI